MIAVNWQLAACNGAPSELFFPTETGRGNAKAALAICKRCPVRRRCLDRAIAEREEHGVWGGTTEAERREMFPKVKRTYRPRQCQACGEMFNPRSASARYCSDPCRSKRTAS